MRPLFFILIITLIVLSSMSQSTATIPPVSLLGSQQYGGPAERIAVKYGINFDTVFVGSGVQVKAIQVSHATPNSPTNLSGLAFNATGAINALAIKDSIILAATNDGLLIRNYRTNTNYTLPSGLLGNMVSDVVIGINRAYIGMPGYGFRVIDISNLASISILSGSPNDTTVNFTVNALAFKSNGILDTLIMAGYGHQGLRVYDVTTPGVTIPQIGIEWNVSSGDYRDVVVKNDSIYVADPNYGYRAFRRFVANLTTTTGQSLSSNTKYLTLVNNDSLLITSSSGGFQIAPLTAGGIISTATLLSGTSPNEIVGGWSGSNLIYVAFGNQGFQIFTITFIYAPNLVGNGIDTGDFVYDITTDGENLYVANGVSGVHIINVFSHTEIGGSPFSWQAGVSYQRVLVRENTLYAIWPSGISIVNVQNPTAPAFITNYTTNVNGIDDADVAGDSLLVVGDDVGIKVLNVINPYSVFQVGSTINLPWGCSFIKVVRKDTANYLYAVPGIGNLAIWSFSNPASPTFLDSTNGLPSAQFATDGQKYAYLIKGDSVLRLGISNPSNIQQNLKNIYSRTTSNGSSIDLAGNYVHLGSEDSELRIFNVADTLNPVLVDSFAFQDVPLRINIAGLNLLTANQGGGYYHLYDPYGAAIVVLHTVKGLPKDTVTVPVEVVDPLSGLGALSFEMFFAFDTNYVQFVDLQRGPGLPSGDSLLFTLAHSSLVLHTDTLKVVRADSSGIAGADTLFKIRLRVRDTAPVVPLVQITTISSNHVLFSEGFPATHFMPGKVKVIPRFGDANQNGSVSAADASLILQSVLGLIAVPSPAFVLADVSNNGEIRAYDAALILKRLVNQAFKYPVEINYNLKQATAPLNKDIKILLTTEKMDAESEKTMELNANSITYGISMHNVKEIWSVEMVIDLGKGQKFIGYKLSPLYEEMTVRYRQEGNMLYMSMASGTPFIEDGNLMQIICQITDAEQLKPIDVQQFIVNESLIQNIEGSLSGIPKIYALNQNYPNPFNPVTEIKYQLPNASKVTLTIYNILGQHIKTLVNVTQPAGFYSVRWNGRDDAGINVASGVYFYRIRAENFVKTRKMLFMK